MKLKLPLKGVTALFCHSFNWPLEDVCCNVPCVPDLNLQQQSNNSGDENWEWKLGMKCMKLVFCPSFCLACKWDYQNEWTSTKGFKLVFCYLNSATGH